MKPPYAISLMSWFVSCFATPPDANCYLLNGFVGRTAQADLIIGLGGDGTLLEPAVDSNTIVCFMGCLIT
jgi:NAD kinase